MTKKKNSMRMVLKDPALRKKWLREEVTDIGAEIAGNLLISLAICSFVLQADIPLSGFSGVALLLYRFFRLPIGVTTLVMNIPVALICYKLIGRKFIIKSFRCMVISTIMVDVLGRFMPVYSGNRLIATLLTGVCYGVGYGLIYMRHSSTGGADFILMAVRKVKPHLKLGTIIFIMDTVVVVIGGIIMRTFDGIVYGMIVIFLTSTVVDKVMYNANAGRIGLIVTDNGADICRCIDKVSSRGSTILAAKGGYTGSEKAVVMVASSPKEMYSISEAVKRTDEASFMIIMNSNEVHGEGFRVI